MRRVNVNGSEVHPRLLLGCGTRRDHPELGYQGFSCTGASNPCRKSPRESSLCHDGGGVRPRHSAADCVHGVFLTATGPRSPKPFAIPRGLLGSCVAAAERVSCSLQLQEAGPAGGVRALSPEPPTGARRVNPLRLLVKAELWPPPLPSGLLAVSVRTLEISRQSVSPETQPLRADACISRERGLHGPYLVPAEALLQILS